MKEIVEKTIKVEIEYNETKEGSREYVLKEITPELCKSGYHIKYGHYKVELIGDEEND